MKKEEACLPQKYKEKNIRYRKQENESNPISSFDPRTDYKQMIDWVLPKPRLSHLKKKEMQQNQAQKKLHPKQI